MELQLGKSIRALRTQKGVTQEALADHLGVSFQAVSKWEVGTTMPDISLLPEIAIYFGVPIDSLFSLPEAARLIRIENLINDTQALSGEQFDGAEGYLTSLLAQDPDKARACYLLACLYLKQAGSLRDRAQGYARHAMLRCPESKAFQSTLVSAMGGVSGDFYANRHYRLIAFLQDFIRAHPKNFQARDYLMDQLMADRRLEEAEALLADMQRLLPRHARLLFYEGDILYAQGAHDRALATWQRGITDHDGPAAAGHFYYAERMERIGRYDEAIAEYQEDFALSEKPRFIDAPLAMAQIHEMRGAYDLAIEMREEVIRVFQTEWNIVSGEAVDAQRREIERLRLRQREDAQPEA